MAVGIPAFILLAAAATFLAERWSEGDSKAQRTALLGLERGIVVEPPGSKATAFTKVEGESYGWFLWEFSGQQLAPGEYEASEDGRRIAFGVRQGVTYALSLLVLQEGKFLTYQLIWRAPGKPDPPPDPDDPPPPDLPPLSEMSRLALQWAQGMSAAAKSQAVRVGGNFQLVGAKLAAGGFAPGDYREQSNKAISELKSLNGEIHQDWRAWEMKWVAEMTIRVDSGKIPKTVQGVGQSFIDVGLGLVEVRP